MLSLTASLALAIGYATPAWAEEPPPPRDYETGVCATAERNQFSDVPVTSRSASAIDCLASLGIVNGFSDGTYRPGQIVDRASVAVFIGRTAEYLTFEAVFDDNTPPPFEDLSDVTEEQYFYIRGLFNRGVVQGADSDTYGPHVPVSRAQSAALVQRLHGLVQDQATAGQEPEHLPPGDNYYADDDGSIHEPAINAVSGAGVLQGTGTDQFSPQKGLNRGQLALLLARYLQFVQDARG